MVEEPTPTVQLVDKRDVIQYLPFLLENKMWAL